MAKIVDQWGNAIDMGALREPQTSRIAALENRYLTPALDGLTPAKLAAALKAADDGDLLNQHRVFADMEERDAHLAAEMGKRKLAVMGLDWDIVPPREATAAEKRAAEWARGVLEDAVTPIEDLILALMDGVGHGFSAVELAWRREGAELLPEFLPRPQEWFRLDRARRELRLTDNSADGAPLAPFGWVLHTHGTPKTGYLGRAGLYRGLVWPFIYKAYALGDFAEFLETYGLPVVVGKYGRDASAEERASLLRAVTALGHDARAIMPLEMQLEIQKVTAEGSGTPHLAMAGWCDGAISKLILGQVLSAEAKPTGLGSGLAEVHDEVRHDIRDADARQIAGTITRDLIYPLAALNLGGIDSLRRCPRLVFDTGEPESVAQYAEALPKLVAAGLKSIPAAWVHEKLRIPQPQEGEATLGAAPSPPFAKEGAGGISPVPAALAALAAEPPHPAGQAALDAALAGLDPAELQAQAEALIRPVLEAAVRGASEAELLGLLAEAWPHMDESALVERLERILFAAELFGRIEAGGEAIPGQ